MKEHGILFSEPMVRAIIEGRKTQTRRIIKNPEWYGCTTGDCPHSTQAACDEAMVFFAPYPVGTRIWVKETWSPDHAAFYPHFPIVYRADGEMDIEHGEVYSPEAKRTYPFRWRPSIHMRRSDSRLTLEVTGVKVERVQSIIALDAIAEGWPSATKNLVCCKTDPPCMWELATQGDMAAALPDSCEAEDAIEWFSDLWISINGEDSWESNPWCWCYTFKVLEIKK